ncbi:DUF6939 family protein [Hymenobacter baengnokdamensis]|uniref:DUF6939 family protein n=1 Tax=Hymenobacter baengnokdamensis TaxID=2615203 RepID=UPI00177F9E33|nr:hypothetical protein [Hymenobacter baengnokdamensis]
MIYVESKRKSLATIRAKHPNSVIIDVTSRGEEPWVQVSPFYPHGGIPVPYSESIFSASVEGVWQGLKVFEGEDVDFSKFTNEAMKGIKRTVRKFGKPLGHRKGVYGTELLDYGTAREKIYLRTYAWMLENKVADIIERLTHMAETGDVVLLDYDTNDDITNLKSPISHASLVKLYIEKKHPHLKVSTVAPPVDLLKADIIKPAKPPRKRSTPKPSVIKGKDDPGQLSFL